MTEIQHLLLKIMEECAEISQVCSKASQFGLEESHPDMDQNNLQRIRAEFGDLMGTVKYLYDVHGVEIAATKECMDSMTKKADKLEKYLKYSKSLGMVR